MGEKKNPAAVALGKLRWKTLTAKQRKEITAQGGKNAWANVSPEERSRMMSERRKKGMSDGPKSD